jgi:Acetyltransferase (GNAT) family.
MIDNKQPINTILNERTNERTNEIILESQIEEDEITDKIGALFDYQWGGHTKECISYPNFPSDFNIGVIVGSSGSGKSTIANNVFGKEEKIEWDNSKCIASNFESFEDASNRFGAVGLNSIPTWLKPYRVLSNGERFRANMARRLKDNCVIDEFTSVVNREVAISCSMSIEKYIRKNNIKNVVLCSCHDDILPYLKPDWVYNTDTKQFYSGRYLRRPKITIKVDTCDKGIWTMFKRHHYLSGELNNASRCYVAYIEDEIVAFASILAFPSREFKHGFREHRIVVLPDYQGMGIGNKLSEMLGQCYVDNGCRYFVKTSNPRMGQHRDNSPLWRPTSHNHCARKDYANCIKRDSDNKYRMSNEGLLKHMNRICYCHEYIGNGETHEYKEVRTDGQMSIFDFLS